jgi:UDP-N-acetylglucosamine--N-acetylmuramyl-(pentapeptide) pyrophosphoryl-undecaprenol N-acetylglucosamine transferase
MVCAGATGGGVYPALAALQALGDEADEFLWVGSENGMEAELVARAGIPFQAIPAAGVHGVGLRNLPGNLWKIVRGFMAARRVIKEFRPDVLFFTGGYVAIPMGLAGRKVPTLLYVPDIEPGLALRVISRFADRIAVTAERSRDYFAKNAPVTVSGYPTRADLKMMEKAKARQIFDLSPDLPTVLVFGGSKGARSINQALMAALPILLKEMQIVHISGTFTWPEVKAAQESLPEEMAARYRAYPYLHEEMGAALAAADLVVSRAGASALGEYPLFGLAAILVPYPYAWRYQKVNAGYLEQRGGAVILKDEDLADKLSPTLRSLMSSEDERERMKSAMRAMAQPKAANKIADLLRGLAQGTI